MIERQERRFERSCVPLRVAGVIHELREEKEQAVRANHDKSRFLAVASHDLRQPIHALGLYIAELQRKISGEEEQHLVGQVARSVDAIATLVDALLDISRLDAGGVVPQKQACDMTELLDRVTNDFQMQAKIKQIRLVVRPFNGMVESDPVLLERIVTNLLSNALRYTHPNGTVLIGCRRRGNDLQIEVRDNGIGIDKRYHASIFNEYFQLNQPRLDAQMGLGLGLAIVDRLVKLLGHKISLRSAPNMGSTFALRLNLYAGQRDPVREPIAAEKDGCALADKKLLIVDDDSPHCNDMATLLRSWGCAVSSVNSLKAVQRQLMKGESWDMVICDGQMEVTGLDVIQMVRQYLDQPVPCILLSTDGSADIFKQPDDDGHHFLHKPVKPAKLRSLMHYLLKGEEKMPAISC